MLTQPVHCVSTTRGQWWAHYYWPITGEYCRKLHLLIPYMGVEWLTSLAGVSRCLCKCVKHKCSVRGIIKLGRNWKWYPLKMGRSRKLCEGWTIMPSLCMYGLLLVSNGLSLTNHFFDKWMTLSHFTMNNFDYSLCFTFKYVYMLIVLYLMYL